jgi:hypothetical protein
MSVPSFNQFTVDSRCPLKWIFSAHLLNYLSHLGVALRPTASMTALPSPVKPKAFALPRHHGFGLDQDETRAPLRPEPGQNDPEPAIRGLQFGTCRDLSSQDGKLMPKSDDLQMQSGPSLKSAIKSIEQGKDEFTHDRSDIIPLA